jgi:MoaA/NifB/PqqE/SkfB family radical SAM enzyme
MHNKIKVLDIESTNTCNASCPQCLRTNENINVESQYHDVLDFDRVMANVPSDFWPALTEINLNGNTGDNIAHPNIQNIVSTLIKVAPQATIKISTNGGLRNTTWWSNFGKSTAGTRCFVIFGIDGLDDTHALHRVGTSWQKVIDNAKAFINAGGQAVWQMIPFKHNEHQINNCKNLSQQLGFQRFILVSDNRFPADQTQQPVYFKQKQTHIIEAPSIAPTRDICQSMENLDTTKSINCKSIATKWMSIYADGTVWPCCFLMGWHKSPHQGRFYQLINYHFKKILRLDLSQISLYNNKLDDILNSDIWQKQYPNSFSSNPNPVCLQQCSI